MYLQRKIDAFLEEWKASNDRKPLIIKGPRQVGKTESILRFARSHYPHILYINFVEEPKFKQILSDGYSEENILRNISILSPEAALIPHETLLVFDEIQEFPDIATSLKFFKLKGNYDVILSGSMLGLNYRRIESNSVGYSEENILRNISILSPEAALIPHETLLVFDEIQEFPDIATSLKFFKLKGNYDVILSGSMLGLNYRRIESNSVGYKEDFEMTSMDFEEFLWAKGYGESLTTDMLSHMQSLTPFSQLEMDQYGALFLDYCLLGGMPEVVKTYIEQGHFSQILPKQRQLLLDYEEDIRKYLPGLEQTKVLSIFRSIPAQLAKENKKFQITKVARGARLSRYMDAIEWLNDAGMVNLCYCLNFPELPLKGNGDRSRFKIYFKDTGLLIASLDEEAQEDLRANQNLGVYKGALYENMIAEALFKAGLPLFYYKKENSSLEEDFFIRSQHELIPLEVKAGNGAAASLRQLIKNPNYGDIHRGIKLVRGNIGCQENIYTFPYFCAFLLKRYIKSLAM